MSKLYRIKDSKIDKKGLYAKKDIAPGTRIIPVSYTHLTLPTNLCV